jgi:predicted transcriptional regulator YdeE
MNYEIVNLEQKTVAGIKIRTSNSSPSMTQEIGETWQEFYTQGVYASIPGKINGKAIGLYTNYENDVNGEYDVMVCCEVNSLENLPHGLATKVIPAGKYAKFTVQGNMEAVGASWGEIWQTKLDRKFDCDFEEYQECEDMEHMEVYTYISLNS